MLIDTGFLKCIECEVGAFYAQHLFHHLFGFRPLHCKLANHLAYQFKVDTERHSVLAVGIGVIHAFLNPLLILGNVRSVDYQQVFRFRKFVDQQVVDHTPPVVKHHAVETLPRCGLGYIVRKYVVYKAGGVIAGNNNLTHVRHVEHTAGFAHGIMLLGYTLVLDRHVESSERTHLRPQGYMAVMKACFFDFFHKTGMIDFR